MLQSRAALFDLISARVRLARPAPGGARARMSPTPTRRATARATWSPPASTALLGRSGAARSRPCAPQPAHLAVAAGRGRRRSATGSTREVEVKPSGNGVDLPDQLRKMASTELDHQLTTSLYRRYVGMLRTAIGVPQA